MNINTKLTIYLLIFFTGIFLASSASAATLYWVGDGGASVGTAGNWKTTDPSSCGGGDAGAAPGASDIAVFDPDCDNSAAIAANWSVAGVNIQSGYSGTVTQNTGVTLTVGSSNYTQADGTFQGGNSTIDINGTFTLSGGTFTATSGTTNVQGTSNTNNTIFSITAGNFVHNSGMLKYDPSAGTCDSHAFTVDVNSSLALNHLEVAISSGDCGSDSITIASGDTLVVNGNFTDSLGQNKFFNGGTIQVYGNVNKSTNTSYIGTTIVEFLGTAEQTITSSGGSLTRLKINKSSGSVSMAGGTTSLSIGHLDLVQGTFNAPTGILTIGSYDPADNTFFRQTNGKLVHNNGTLKIITEAFGGSAEYFYFDVPTILTVYNLIFDVDTNYNGVDYVDTASGDIIIVEGSLTLSNDNSQNYVNGNYEVKGNVVVSASNSGGSANITLTGNGDQTISSSGGVLVNTTVNKTGGTVSLSGTIPIANNWTWTKGQLNAGTSTLKFTGGSAQTFTPGNAKYYNVEVNKSGNTVTLGGNLWLENELKVVLNTLSTSSSNYTITTKDYNQTGGTMTMNNSVMKLTGNFTRSSGTFTQGNSTVAFQGSNQTLSGGAMTFYRLYKLVNAADTFTITAGDNITIASGGIIRLWGKPEGKTLSIVSSSPGSSYTITKTGNFEAEYTSIQDMNLSGAATAAASTSVSGNTNLTVTKEFISTIRATGGDYSTLSAWEAAVNVDLTAATTKVFSHGGVTGTIPDNSAVSGETSLATATAVHVSSTQILLKTISGTFQSGEKVWLDADHNNYVTISDAGFGAIASAWCYNDWPSGLVDTISISGWTTGANNYVKVYVPASERHNGTINSGFRLKGGTANNTTFVGMSQSYSVIDGIEINGVQSSGYSGVGITWGNGIQYVTIKNSFIHDIQFNRCISLGYNSHYTKIINNIFAHYNTVNGGYALLDKLEASFTPSGVEISNNTFYSYLNIQSIEYGADSNTGTRIRNNVAYVNGTNGNYLITSPNSGSGYNISDDSTAPGAYSQKNKALNEMDFTSTTLGAENMHIQSNSVAKDNGVDLSTDPNFPVIDDIDGDSRLGLEPGAWDIGADEYQEVDPVVSLGGIGAVGDEPVAYWKFDEGYGDTAHNEGSAGSTANGTLQSGGSGGNATNTAMWDKNGKYGGAMEFDGSNDYVDLNNPSVINSLTEGTISAWFKVADISDSRTMLSYYNGTTQIGLGLAVNTSGKVLVSTKNNDVNVCTFTSNQTLNTGEYYHVAYSVSDSGNQLYINGILQQVTYTAGGSWSSVFFGDLAVNSLGIGWRDLGSSAYYDYFSGLIDEVKIFNYALSADQVKREYNGGQAMKFGSASTDASGNPSSAANREYCVPGDTATCNPPVGEWLMEQNVSGASQTIHDTSGNGNNGTTSNANGTGMDCTKNGKAGYGCSFDGVDDYVSVANNTSLQITNGTISAWAYQTEANNAVNYGIFNHPRTENRNTTAYGLYTYDDNKHLYFVLQDSQTVNALGVVQLNTWMHYAVSWNGSVVRIYVNGQLVKEENQTVTPAYTPSIVSAIGLMGTTDEFRGKIDQVRIYNYARTPAQIAWEYNKGKPIAQWKMDECTGDIIHDESGNGSNGTIELSTTGTQTDTIGNGSCTVSAQTPWYNGRTGKFKASLNFDGTSDYVNIAPSSNSFINQTGTDTLSAWVYPVSTESYTMIIDSQSVAGTENNQYNLYLDADRKVRRYLSNGCASNSAINLDTWTHVLSTYDGTNVRIYINGVLDQTCPLSKPAVTTSVLRLGARAAATYQFAGQIDDVRIYNYALTEEQVREAMNEGNAVRF